MFSDIVQSLLFHEKGSHDLVSKEATTYGLACTSIDPNTTQSRCTLEQLLDFAYYNQSCSQISLILSKDSSIANLSDIHWKYICTDKRVKVINKTDNEELTQKLITSIKEQTGQENDEHKNVFVLSNPQVVIRALQGSQNETYTICLDVAPTPLYKRMYKMFNNPASLRATLAFQALLAADYEPSKTLVDPMCGGGTIPIEATILCSEKSPHEGTDFCIPHWNFVSPQALQHAAKPRQRQQSNILGFDWNITAVKAAQKNAAVTQLDIDVVRYEAEFLPHKFDDDTVDCIVTHPPSFNKKDVKKKLHKNLIKLFQGAALVLKPHSRLVIVTNDEVQLKAVFEDIDSTKQLRHIKSYNCIVGLSEFALVVYKKIEN